MDTLKNFNRYWTVTFNYEYYENGIQVPPDPGVPTTTSQDYPYWAQPSYPQDPANFINPWEPWSDIIKTPLAPVSWNATYTIKYCYTSEIIIAYFSYDWTIDPAAPYVSRDPNWFLLLKNIWQVSYGCEQLCIEDTDFGVPTLNYINQRYSVNYQPWIMTAELRAIIENEWWSNVYCPWITSIPWWKFDSQASDPAMFEQVTFWSWDSYSSYILTSTDIEIIRSTFVQFNMRWFNWSTPTRFSDTSWRIWIFSSLFNYSYAVPYIKRDQNQQYQSMLRAPAWWLVADYSTTSACLTTDGNQLIRDRLEITYNSSTDRQVQYWLIRLKDPSRCIYTS